MFVRQITILGFDIRDIGFGLLSLVSVSLTLVVQLAWIIFFDSMRLDVYAPNLLFAHVLPALTIAVLLAILAFRFYTAKVALLLGGIVFAVSAIVSTYTIQFFRLCGPGC